jgi:polar amino acid transport system substrate-binding protein
MKKLLFLLTAFAMTVSVFARGQKNDQAGVTQILIGTNASPAPYGWINEDGAIDGYDAAVITALQELLPQYRFVLENTEFPSIFAGIDSGRYKIGANNLSWRKEREEKYLYGKTHYIYNNTGIVVRKGRSDIKGLNDLGGKTNVINPNGAFPQLFAEEFNASHSGNPIKITYADQDDLKTYQDIINGDTDFVVRELVAVELTKKEFGIEVDFIPLSKEEQEQVQNPKSYFIFPRTTEGEKIRDDVDGALQQLIGSGKLREISLKYFGYDISQ